MPAQPAPAVPKATYEAMFRHQHGTSEPTMNEVKPSLVAAANDVLGSTPTPQSQGTNLPLPGEKTPAPNETKLASNTETVASVANETFAEPVDDLEF